IYALGHFREQSALPELSRILREDVRPYMRGASAYALGKIGTEDAETALRHAESREREEEVLDEIRTALRRIADQKKEVHE
ncbi:MAG: HEAT repeat domain-containing protein, partial [Bhargavaea sp.]